MAVGDNIGTAKNWVSQLRNIKEIFGLPEIWLFVNFLALIILWTVFYFFIRNKLAEGDKKNLISILIISSVLTFASIPFYFTRQTVSIIISVIAFSFNIIAPSYCAWTLIDFDRLKQLFRFKLKKEDEKSEDNKK